jgi:hypothetical protein
MCANQAQEPMTQRHLVNGLSHRLRHVDGIEIAAGIAVVTIAVVNGFNTKLNATFTNRFWQKVDIAVMANKFF